MAAKSGESMTQREPDPVKAFHRIRVRRDRVITTVVLLFSLLLLGVGGAYFPLVGTEQGYQLGVTDKLQWFAYGVTGVGGLGSIIAVARLMISFLVS